jgi:NADPH:quinone reductase-like Zn-dependent oxidoreductase
MLTGYSFQKQRRSTGDYAMTTEQHQTSSKTGSPNSYTSQSNKIITHQFQESPHRDIDMKAERIEYTKPSGVRYNATTPAPTSAIRITGVAKPQPPQPGQLNIRMKATTVIRDSLTWPELYTDPPAHMGNDFAGIVTEVHPTEREFKPGDEVYGMTHADRCGTWAEYAVVTTEEANVKPQCLSWAEAAALPLSALTADQALFVHAHLEVEAQQPKRVLVTGAAGGVGMFVVALAAAAEHHVVAATSSNGRNEEFVRSMGAAEVVEYGQLDSHDKFDVVIDTVGGEVLARCWKIVRNDAYFISVDSASWNFVEEHKKNGLSAGKYDVQAKFFIVEPSRDSMRRISAAVEKKGVKGLVAKTMSFEQAREAYELSATRGYGRGKIVLVL